MGNRGGRGANNQLSGQVGDARPTINIRVTESEINCPKNCRSENNLPLMYTFSAQIQGPPPGMSPFGAPAPFGGPPPFGMPPPGFGGPGPGPGQYPGWGMTPPTAQPISGQPVMNPVAAQANAVPNEAPAAAVAAPSSQVIPSLDVLILFQMNLQR